jgi:hypothetical protein
MAAIVVGVRRGLAVAAVLPGYNNICGWCLVMF